MFTRVVHTLLALATLIGVVFLVRAAKTEQELRGERNRLAKKYGSIVVDDTSKFYLQRIVEPEQANYLWRAYVPENEKLIVKHHMLSGSGTGVVQHSDEQGLIRFRVGPRHGRIRSYQATQRSATYAGFGNREELAQFLWEHWAELEIEIAGDREPIVSDMSSVVTLLSVKVPQHLGRLAVQEVPKSDRGRLADRLAKPILQLRCGTEAAFAEEELKE